MKRAAYISNVLAHISSFHVPYIEMLRGHGYTVDVITNAAGAPKPDYCDHLYDCSIARSPYSVANVKAFREIKKIILENQYDFIHVHTPMGGTVGRLAAMEARKNGTKVFYTCHGFHFFDGAPQINWLLYFNMERALTKYTDCLITINQEDYRRAQTFANRQCQVQYAEGVGVDLERFTYLSPESRMQMNHPEGSDCPWRLFYAAEFIPRKNHRFLIDAMQRLKDEPVELILAGKGPELERVKQYAAEQNVAGRITFLGYRKDIPELLRQSDIVVSSSRQEGYPINVAEAVATGLPCVVTKIRGNADVVADGINGFTFENGDVDDFCRKIKILIDTPSLYEQMAHACLEKSREIDVRKLVNQMEELYQSFGLLEEAE